MAQGFSKLAAEERTRDLLRRNFDDMTRRAITVAAEGRAVVARLPNGNAVARHYF